MPGGGTASGGSVLRRLALRGGERPAPGRRLSRWGKPPRASRTRRTVASAEAPHVVPEEGRARLFRRPRHLDHPEVARDRIRLRGRHLHRRPRPGRGARAGAQEGRAPRRGAREHLHRGPARDLRARLRLPDVPRQRRVRGPLPPRHLDRPPAHRQAPGRDRRGDRCGRHRPRRHRQGQRPGPLRALRLRARPAGPRHRPLARVGPHLAHQAPRVRREEPNPHRQGQARRGPVLGRRQPPAHLLRGQGAREPRRGGAALRLPAHHRPGKGPRHARIRRDRLRAGRPGRRSTASPSPPPPSSPASTSSAAGTASAASTSSRTASSA